jgi:CHAT domain-containing protein
MGLAVEFKFKYKLVEVSNYLVKNYDEFYNYQPNINKYSFQIMSGFFYRYIKNDKRALMRFISARANPYHWSREIVSYEDMTRDHLLIYEIFEIFLFDKKYEDAQYYLNIYTDLYNELEQGLKNNTYFVSLDKDMFIEIKRKSLDMKRRLLFSESKHEKSELVIDEVIALEDKKPYYGKFNLSMLKFGSQFMQKKYSNDIFLKKLDSLYYVYNKEFDSQYYGFKKDLGEFSEQYINSKLVALKTELKNINIINELSYENQINMLLDIGLKMSALENEIHSHIIDKKQTNEILNYKLKVDDLDRYNSILLNLNEKNSDMYFELLNKRYSEKDYEKLQLIKTEFDVFQQNIKTEFKKSEKIDIVSFQNKLKSNQAYIRFSKLNKLVFVAHLITKDHAQIIKISETDLGKLINFYTSQITNKKLDIYSYNLLFKPIVDKLSPIINQLFIKNEGLFTNVNIESLWNPTKKKYLFDMYEINYVERPSAIFKIDTISEFDSAFLFGNPDFSNGSSTLETINSKIRAGINPLPYTEKEINALNILLTENEIKTVTTNLESSTEESLYANTKSSIIHLATHGFFIEGNKYNLFSFNWGLLAANSKNNIQTDFKKEARNDGIIFGSEIITKNFTQTELVVLSACETGFGNSTFFGGENLANSFLRAGAKNIISTLWPVDDKITQKFMITFYRELLKNKNINLALRTAKQIIKKEYSDPNYWAPFVLLQNNI